MKLPDGDRSSSGRNPATCAAWDQPSAYAHSQSRKSLNRCSPPVRIRRSTSPAGSRVITSPSSAANASRVAPPTAPVAATSRPRRIVSAIELQRRPVRGRGFRSLDRLDHAFAASLSTRPAAGRARRTCGPRSWYASIRRIKMRLPAPDGASYPANAYSVSVDTDQRAHHPLRRTRTCPTRRACRPRERASGVPIRDDRRAPTAILVPCWPIKSSPEKAHLSGGVDQRFHMVRCFSSAAQPGVAGTRSRNRAVDDFDRRCTRLFQRRACTLVAVRRVQHPQGR